MYRRLFQQSFWRWKSTKRGQPAAGPGSSRTPPPPPPIQTVKIDVPKSIEHDHIIGILAVAITLDQVYDWVTAKGILPGTVEQGVEDPQRPEGFFERFKQRSTASKALLGSGVATLGLTLAMRRRLLRSLTFYSQPHQAATPGDIRMKSFVVFEFHQSRWLRPAILEYSVQARDIITIVESPGGDLQYLLFRKYRGPISASIMAPHYLVANGRRCTTTEGITLIRRVWTSSGGKLEVKMLPI